MSCNVGRKGALYNFTMLLCSTISSGHDQRKVNYWLSGSQSCPTYLYKLLCTNTWFQTFCSPHFTLTDTQHTIHPTIMYIPLCAAYLQACSFLALITSPKMWSPTYKISWLKPQQQHNYNNSLNLNTCILITLKMF